MNFNVFFRNFNFGIFLGDIVIRVLFFFKNLSLEIIIGEFNGIILLLLMIFFFIVLVF